MGRSPARRSKLASRRGVDAPTLTAGAPAQRWPAGPTRRAGAVLGPRHSSQQRSTTVPSGQSEPQLDSRNRPWRGRWSVYGMQGVKACIGLAVPGRPIGPRSRRTGAPEASATGRDRNPRCSRDCSRDAPRHPGDERVQDGTTLRHPPARRPGGAQERTSKHTGGPNLGPGVRLPRALRALAHQAVVAEEGSHPTVRVEPTAPRWSQVAFRGVAGDRRHGLSAQDAVSCATSWVPVVVGSSGWSVAITSASEVSDR